MAASLGYSLSRANTFITIAALSSCTAITFIVFFLVYCHRRLARRTQQEPPASVRVAILDPIAWDEIRIPATIYSSDGEVCAICLEELAGGEGVKVMPRCRHTFHDGCIDQWLGKRSARCPVCRDVIAEKESRKDDVSIDIPMHDLSSDEI